MDPVRLLTQVWKSNRGLVSLFAVLILANVLLYGVLEQWLAPRLYEREATFLKRQTEVRQLVRNRGDFSQAPEHLFVLARQDVSRFYEAVPPYQEFTALVEELMTLAGRSGLDIVQVSYKPDELPGGRLLQYDLSFGVDGDYARVKEFVYAIEQSRRLMAIRQISLNQAEGGGVNLKLLVETYFRPGGEDS